MAPAVGPGRVVLVVGESGAGKDAILTAARAELAGDPAFVFPTRIITRPSNAAEEHDSVSPANFRALLERGALALHWEAHGLHYGIPAEIDDAVRAGKCVIFNASRTIVPVARTRYENVTVVLIKVQPGLRAQRLAGRGRESGEGIAARLARGVAFATADANVTIDNSGALSEAVAALLDWLRSHPP